MEVHCSYLFDNYTYKCIVSNEDLTEGLKIQNFNGDHHPGKTNKDVTIVFFEGCKLQHFPRDLRRFFPKIAVIQIIECNLNEITKEDLQGYPDLIYFGIIDNELSYLPGNLFEYTPKVEFIDFSLNKIKWIGPMIFEPLINVEGINLKYNQNIHCHWIPSQKEKSVAKNLEDLKKIVRNCCRPMETLQNIAGEVLIRNIDRKNAPRMYFYGYRYRIRGLMRRAFEIMKKTRRDIEEDCFDFLSNSFILKYFNKP